MLAEEQNSTNQTVGQAGGKAEASEYVGQGVRFERIRRITGYLVGTTDRFNNAKRAEERDRVKHINFARWGTPCEASKADS